MRFNRKTVSVITAPATLAVPLSDMKDYLRVDTSDDDTLITDLINAASETIKQYIRRSLITETLELSADGFTEVGDEKLLAIGPGVHTGSKNYYLDYPDEIELPFLPIQSVTSIKTFNRSNTEATFSSSNYELDEKGGRVYLNEGQTWPSDLRAREAVKIRYVAGYGDASSDIPEPILASIRLYVASMYDCRGACEMPELCKKTLAPYKILDNMAYS
jgi:hypothetical protein